MAASVNEGEGFELLHAGERSRIQRVRLPGAAASVVFKTGASSAAERQRLLQHEWDILKDLRGAQGVVQAIAFEPGAAGHRLVLQDDGGVSLDRLALAHALSISDVLSIALSAARALENLHGAQIVHGNINPSHLVLSGPARTVTLIDFAQARRGIKGPALLGRFESLAYISPEQTGRMNRTVDHRADFYSIGVILYELIVGSVPFSHASPRELVHAHVARRPRDPGELTPGVPRALARIVLKLLAKEAEDRYQSGAGLRRDLLRCKEHLELGEREFDFPLGSFDPPEQFRLPQRLYGRTSELASAQASFEQVLPGAARVLAIEGLAGVGKSALIAQLTTCVSAAGAFCAAAKFEQYESSVPYSAFSQALDVLAQQLLASSADELQALRGRLEATLAGSAAALSDLCPALHTLLATRGAPPALPAREAQTRLQQALHGFFEAIAGPRQPVVLVLDDVHNADSDSASLLQEILLASQRLPLFVVLGYRANELGTRHPMRVSLDALAAHGIPVETLAVGPLGKWDLTHLIRDATCLPEATAEELAQIVLSRTGGNAFFAREFLSALNTGGQLSRVPEGWQVDLDAVRRRGITDNIVDLLVERIARLPVATQRALRMAACLGGRFDTEMLARAAGPSAVEALSRAVDVDLVLPLRGGGASGRETAQPEHYQFSHDRIQSAVLAALSESSRCELHLELGRQLIASCRPETRASDLFQIISHLNQASALLEEVERIDLAHRNLEGAAVALRRAAAAEALQLVRAGLRELGSSPWRDHYELTRDLHLAGAEAAFALAAYDALETFASTTLAQVHSPLEVVRLRVVQGLAAYAQFRLPEAIGIYLQTLAELNIVIPAEPSLDQVAEELRATAEALRHLQISDLLELPVCSDARILSIMELLGKIILFAGSMKSQVFSVATCRLVQLSLAHGNSAESASGYTFYGHLLSRDHDLERAYAFGKLALELGDRFGDRAVLSQTYIYAYYQLMHWKVPFTEIIKGLHSALLFALEAGSPFNAACSATTLCIAQFWAGEPLGRLSDDLAKRRQLVVQFGQGLVLNWHEIWQQVVANLRNESTPSAKFAGPSYDESVRLDIHRAAGDGSALFNYHVGKALVCYVLGDFSTALQQMEEIQPWTELFATQFWAIPLAFLDSLCRLGACGGASPERRAVLLSRVEETLEKMQGWLPHNPVVVEHKVLILQAEVARARAELRQAERLFERAVTLTLEVGVVYEKAFVCELAARCSAELGERDVERRHLRCAHRAYLEWGALTKVIALERRFASLPRVATSSVNLVPMTEHGVDLDPLDLVSLIDAGQVIASELKLDGLLRQLMRLLIENAGAQSAYVLMQKAGAWVIEAGHFAERGMVTLLESLPLEAAETLLPAMTASVVNYVARTGETILLDDASRSPLFARERELGEAGAVSVLCFPLKRQGQTLAIAYLENQLVRGVFTSRGVRLLQALSTQAVTSLENAMLYSELEQKVEARTRELVQKNEELSSTLVRLTEVREQLVVREKLAALGALTAGIAHEIKNPLNFVANFALSAADLVTEIRGHLGDGAAHITDLASVQSLLDQLTRTVTVIGSHAKRASGIVTGMAMHARQSGGSRELADLNRLLEGSVQIVCENTRRSAAPIVLQAEYDSTVGLVEVVVQDMSRVFINLLNNACQAVEAKRATMGADFVPRVTTRTRSLGDYVEVSFLDNGPGVPDKLKEQIFHPFFTTKAPHGTGLGLSISHDIVVRAHGGDLRVQSVVNEFTEFVLRLPKRALAPFNAQ